MYWVLLFAGQAGVYVGWYPKLVGEAAVDTAVPVALVVVEREVVRLELLLAEVVVVELLEDVEVVEVPPLGIVDVAGLPPPDVAGLLPPEVAGLQPRDVGGLNRRVV